MSYRLLSDDPSRIQDTFHLCSLAARLIAASRFTDEQIQDLLDTSCMLADSKADCVQAAAARIRKARNNHEKVFVAGDYDADGITSTAIMKETLDVLGITNGYYIPDRFKEGYGLSAATVRAVHEKGYSLIITVDNGVKCAEAIEASHSLGIDIIVTDHHTIEEPVYADILTHPDYMEPEFAFLSGAGVALEISRLLIGDSAKLTALCAIALIGDVMPLWRENRRIVRAGFAALRQGRLPSISPLLRKGSVIDTECISFQIVPKLNSVGRMNDISNVNTLVPFLLSADERAISSYARQLNHVNEARKHLSESTVKAAEKLAVDEPFAVIADETFHEGVVGLAAGKLARQWHKPVLIFARNGDLYKGSGRSIPGFNMYAFLKDFPDMEAFGGHEQAVGLSLSMDRLEPFREYVRARMQSVDLSSFLVPDPAVEIDSCELTVASVSELERLAPFPRELIRRIAVTSPELAGTKVYDRVIRYRFHSDNGGFEGVQFTPRRSLPQDVIPCLVGVPSINRFRDRTSVQVTIESFSLNDAIYAHRGNQE